MHITPTGKLSEWLIEAGDVEALSGFDVDDNQFVKLLERATRAHPEYTHEEKRAWAIMCLRGRGVVPKDTRKQIGEEATREINVYGHKIEAQSRGFLALKTKIDELCNKETETLDYLKSGIDARLEDVSKSICEESSHAREAMKNIEREIKESSSKMHAGIIGVSNSMMNLTAWGTSILSVIENRNSLHERWMWVWRVLLLVALSLIAVSGFSQTTSLRFGTVTLGANYIDTTNKGQNVTCVSGCSGGTTDTDDGSVAGGQSTGLSIALGYVWNGAAWVRVPGGATDGVTVNLGTNNDVTVTGTVTANAGSGTFVVGDGAGALNVICDSGCGGAASFEDDDPFTATTTPVNIIAGLYDTTPPSITDGNAGAVRMNSSRVLMVDGSGVTQPVSGTVTVTDGAGALNVIVDSGTLTAVTSITNSVTVTDGAGALNVICDSGCGGAATFTDNAAFTFATTAVNIGAGVLDDAAPNAATENSAAAFRISANRMQLAQIGDGAGNERRANVTAANELNVIATAQPGVDIGDVTLNNASVAVTGTFWQATQPISAAALPLPTGASTLAEQQTQTTALQLIDNPVQVLGTDTYTEASSSGFTLGAVRRDADTTLVSLTNEFGPLQMDANGRLKVEAFSGETLPVSLASTTVTGTVAVTQSGTWNITDITGTVSLPTGAATAANQTSVIGTDGAAGPASVLSIGGTQATGEIQEIQVDADGQLQADVLTLPSVTIGTFPDNEPFNVAQINGVTVLMGNGATGTGSQRVTIASDNTAVSGMGVGATGSAVPANANYIAGTNGTNTTAYYVDPCQREAKTYTPIDIVSATTTVITTATASQRVYVCSLVLFSAGTQNAALVEGTGGTCGTGTAGVMGGATAGEGFNFTAQTGVAFGNGNTAIGATAGTNVDLCIISSAAVQLSGHITWVKEP